MIEFINVSKIYPGNLVAMDNVNLKFNTGEFICLIGTSGSGKTTCMRMINRMNIPTSGVVKIDGRDISKVNAVDLRRQIGYVIQQIGLMPHMTIYENIVMVPKLLKWPKDKMDKIAADLLDKADMPKSYLDYYPQELSGGQQQRIGVLRALAADQEIILMDEPFGALDPITRETLQQLIKKLQKEMGKTIVFVTHDMDEALQLSDRTVVMDKGKVIQFDTPENILTNPVNEFVRNMVGEDRINQAKFDYDHVEKIMNKNPITIQADKPATDAVRLMHDKRVDTLFVINEDGVLQGHVDFFRIDRKEIKTKKVRDFLNEATYVYSDTKIRDVIYYINDLGYKNMPVVDKESHKLVGLATRASVVEALYDGLWSDYQPEDEDQIDITPHEEEIV
ncbi:MAG: ABC transporter ATP-binding protein [Tissierellia bacterium]|nr:ABC transporter ATP-binding protein [Tissierellia bacterium]